MARPHSPTLPPPRSGDPSTLHSRPTRHRRQRTDAVPIRSQTDRSWPRARRTAPRGILTSRPRRVSQNAPQRPRRPQPGREPTPAVSARPEPSPEAWHDCRTKCQQIRRPIDHPRPTHAPATPERVLTWPQDMPMAKATARDTHVFTQESDVTQGLSPPCLPGEGVRVSGYRQPQPMIRGYCGPRPVRRTHQ